jgi:NTE family protein
MAELPAEVEAHVLPAGGTSSKDDNPLGYRDFSAVAQRIDASYAASADYLDDWVLPREDRR